MAGMARWGGASLLVDLLAGPVCLGGSLGLDGGLGHPMGGGEGWAWRVLMGLSLQVVVCQWSISLLFLVWFLAQVMLRGVHYGI